MLIMWQKAMPVMMKRATTMLEVQRRHEECQIFTEKRKRMEKDKDRRVFKTAARPN